MMAGPEIAVSLEGFGAVYVEIPKVACSSIKAVLARLLGIDLEAGNPHITPLPMAEAHLVAGEPLFPGRYAFAFVRNPWDRLVSCYRDKIGLEVDGFTQATIRPGVADCLAGFEAFRAGMPFTEFVEVVATIADSEADPHFRSQAAFITNPAGAVGVDFVGRFETLGDDFMAVQAHLGLDAGELPRLQAAPAHAQYRDFYDQRTRQLVAERYGQDIALFGYDF